MSRSGESPPASTLIFRLAVKRPPCDARSIVPALPAFNAEAPLQKEFDARASRLDRLGGGRYTHVLLVLEKWIAW